MDKTRILPGDVLVSKGALKLNSSLPEVGLKDITPNGSWLEQKQIQAALEARKHLIEVERIEKSGVLSHAEWREELMLAEVTQKAGSYWQYLGHNVGKRLFLNPEEALFLMEINCLLLKYNEVKVSLQQAYALLLRNKISLIQYKVYASLSRLGYRVFRHQKQQDSDSKEYKENIKKDCCSKDDNLNYENIDIAGDNGLSTRFTEEKDVEVDQLDKKNSETEPDIPEITKGGFDIPMHDDCKNPEKLNRSKDKCNTAVFDQASTSGYSRKSELKINKLKNSKYIQYKIDILKSRKHKTKKCNTIHNNLFDNIPEFGKHPIVNVRAPDSCYLPEKVSLKTNSYYLNIEKIQTKSAVAEEVRTTSSSTNDSIDTGYQNNMNPLRHQNPHAYRGNWTECINFRFSSQRTSFRHFNLWRPQTSLNYFHFNMTFQRPFLYPQFIPRFMANPFLQPLMTPNFSENLSFNTNNCAHRKKRTRDHLKQEHFASIQRLANYVKHSILELRLSDNNVSKLNHLIQTYNTRYKTRLRLSDDFTVIVDENIIDTIDVDDDDDQIAKKVKKTDDTNAFNEKLHKLEQLAYKLKSLEIKNEATSRHRRMFSNLIKRFNDSYNVDYYVNDNFDVVNRNDLTVLSSSDSEEISETTIKRTSRKKLKNPFSILKLLSDKHTEEENLASTSSTAEFPFRYSEITLNTFSNGWLPDKSDFGRAEIVSKDYTTEVIDIKREEFLFDFMKIQPEKFKNWLDIKISFLQCFQQTCELFQYNVKQKNLGVKSLVKPEEINDATVVLKKLNIIENYKAVNEDTDLEVDFDVYNRDVLNFKKSSRPVPHFRVVCVKESPNVPSGADVAGLHSKYKDNVTIVFAVVGIGSISYLQINPVDLPMPFPIESVSNAKSARRSGFIIVPYYAGRSRL